MSYQVFARKYRPQDFDSVIGQEHITRTLKNAIEQKRLAHAYLFVGPRGVGKTSTARILAKALNCEKGPTLNPCGTCDACREISQGISLDVLEIDGASNNGVEQVRELRDNVRFAPAHGRYKIYIIDEVHMLTSAAFNALLKTLEEPPAHVIFIFATTEPQKVLPTILSRCQRFDLRRIPADLIAKHLQFIARNEKIKLDPAAAVAVAKGAEGGLRDAESMLDQLVAFCGDTIKEEDVLSVFGFTAQETIYTLCEAILAGDCPAALETLHEQAESGRDLGRLLGDLIGHLRDLLVAKTDPHVLEGDAFSPEKLKAQAEKISVSRLLELVEQFAATEGRMKWAPNKKLHFEIAIIKAIQTLGQVMLDDVIAALTELRSGRTPDLPKPAGPPARTAPVVKSVEALPKVVREEPQRRQEPSPPVELASVPVSMDPAEVWPRLLAAIHTQRPLISSWVESGTLLSIENDRCLIGFPPGQSMALDSVNRPNNRKLVEEILAGLFGRPVTVECQLREGLIVAPPQAPPEPEPLPDPVQKFREDAMIKQALEIFKGELYPA